MRASALFSMFLPRWSPDDRCRPPLGWYGRSPFDRTLSPAPSEAEAAPELSPAGSDESSDWSFEITDKETSEWTDKGTSASESEGEARGEGLPLSPISPEPLGGALGRQTNEIDLARSFELTASFRFTGSYGVTLASLLHSNYIECSHVTNPA